jgi:hypothetical protein
MRVCALFCIHEQSVLDSRCIPRFNPYTTHTQTAAQFIKWHVAIGSENPRREKTSLTDIRGQWQLLPRNIFHKANNTCSCTVISTLGQAFLYQVLDQVPPGLKDTFEAHATTSETGLTCIYSFDQLGVNISIRRLLKTCLKSTVSRQSLSGKKRSQPSTVDTTHHTKVFMQLTFLCIPNQSPPTLCRAPFSKPQIHQSRCLQERDEPPSSSPSPVLNFSTCYIADCALRTRGLRSFDPSVLHFICEFASFMSSSEYARNRRAAIKSNYMKLYQPVL